jgi:phosphopantetheinyl transferase
MIYTIICDTRKRDFSHLIKEDCRIERQSIPDFPEEIKEYIDRAKNSLAREERQAAYSTLLYSLRCLYGVEEPRIVREKDGKPRLVSHDIFFNISHSDGLVAVSLSDRCDIGVDLQSEISPEKEKRLSERFLSGFSSLPFPLDISYLYLENDIFFILDLPISNGEKITDKWTSFESVLKLSGDGFGTASDAHKLAQNVKTDTRVIKLDNSLFSLSNSIKNG